MKIALLVVVLAATAIATAALQERTAPSTVIEPRIVSIDRSPPVGRAQLGRPTRGRQVTDIPKPTRVQTVGTSDESVTFGVNTRGELGGKRAAMMCKCDVLTVLLDEGDEEKRSYTAPELRSHVPLVTNEYAKTNTQISFGVNVRGEEGPGYSPTWCNCQVQPPVGRAREVEQQDGNDDDDDDDQELDEEGLPAQRTGALRRGSNGDGDSVSTSGVRGSPSPRRGPPMPIQRGVQQHLELEEGASPQEHLPQEHEEKYEVTAELSSVPTAAQVAESTINLQTGAGLALKMTPVATTLRHRHAWAQGIDVLHATEVTQTVAADEVAPVVPVHAAVASEYMFHGHPYSKDGVRLDQAPSLDDTVGASMMLAELAEGTEAPTGVNSRVPPNVPEMPEMKEELAEDSTEESEIDESQSLDMNDEDLVSNSTQPSNLSSSDVVASASNEPLPTANNTTDVSPPAAITPTILPADNTSMTDEQVPQSETQPEAHGKQDGEVEAEDEKKNAVPDLSNSTTTTTTATENVVPAPLPVDDIEESDGDDAMTVIQKLRTKHPHTSEVLAGALSAAASQQEMEMQHYQQMIVEKDRMIEKLLADSKQEHASFQQQIHEHEAYEAKLLITASPSPTPSVSMSASSSSSATPTPTPSPSQSIVIPPEQYVPKTNRKACYNTCRDTNCQNLFETSLQQYTECMQTCASRCYS